MDGVRSGRSAEIGTTTGARTRTVPESTNASHATVTTGKPSARERRNERDLAKLAKEASKVPRFLRFLIWDAADCTETPLVSWTLSLPPLPSVPRSVYTNDSINATLLSHSYLFDIITPIKVDVFEALLRQHPNRPLVTSVCRALREGHWPWTEIPEHYPDTWDHSDRPLKSDDQKAFVRSAIDKEVAAGRYSPDFGSQLLPGMWSLPFSVVPKPHTDPPDFRQVFDYSAGDYAPNALVRKEDATVRLDTVYHLAKQIRIAKKRNPMEKLVVWKSDVSSAYRLVPMSPYWQIKQIVSFEGSRYVDRCNIWGHRPAGRIWCIIMSLVLWIGIHCFSLDDLLAYIDDAHGIECASNLIHYAPHDCSYPRKQAGLLTVWDIVGLGHNQKKQLFGESLTIIGFKVNPNQMTITLPDEARDDLLKAILDFCAASRHTLREFQVMSGLEYAPGMPGHPTWLVATSHVVF
jgi:hypothetical protein